MIPKKYKENFMTDHEANTFYEVQKKIGVMNDDWAPLKIMLWSEVSLLSLLHAK